MTPSLRIVVRTDAPWGTMTLDDYRAQVKSLNLPGAVRKRESAQAIETWQEATGLNYFRYRGAVQQGVHRELENLGIPISCGVENVPYIPGEVYLPIDDDDIFLPNIDGVLKHFSDPNIDLVLWQSRACVHGKDKDYVDRDTIDSCNAAIRADYLLDFAPWIAMLKNHQICGTEIGVSLGCFPRKRRHTVNEMAADLMKTRWLPNNGKIRLLKHPSIVRESVFRSRYYLHSASISFLSRRADSSRPLYESLKALPLHPLYDPSDYVST